MNLILQSSTDNPVSEQTIAALAALCQPRQTVQTSHNVWKLCNAHPCAALEEQCRALALDYAWVPENLSLQQFSLFVTDMDSTLINIECIDELADLQGVKQQVCEITEASMRGKLDFATSLRQRVHLLRGLPVEAMQQVYEQRLALNPGAHRLLKQLQQASIYTVLVSGGFSYFTDRLRAELGFDEAYGNTLGCENGILTGELTGPVIDAQAKAEHLIRAARQQGIQPQQSIAVGDGANDLLMIHAAGLGIAYHGKPVLQQQAGICLNHCGLDGILNLFC